MRVVDEYVDVPYFRNVPVLVTNVLMNNCFLLDQAKLERQLMSKPL